MKEHDFVRLLVLVQISDDYEEPEHIYENVAGKAMLCGITVQPADIGKVLVDLVESGLAKAYRLSTTEPAIEIEGAPPVDQVQGYYFLITERGKEVIDSSRDERWPFDDEGALRPGWCPPRE